MFEEQLRWPLNSQPWEPGLRWVPNYSSLEEHADFARAIKFEEDIAEGMMIKMSLRDFEARYGEHRAVAALAVIVEDEAIGKKRMIHDATHGVQVNHRMRRGDKIRAPGAREKKQLLREMSRRPTKGSSTATLKRYRVIRKPGPGRLGFAAIALNWERPFLGRYMRDRPMKIPAMLRVLMSWLADPL